MAAIIPQHPILLLLTARPGYVPRGSWMPTVAAIDLQECLSEPETAALSRRFLSARSLPDELHALIFRKAGGNPFFVEEVIRSLREAGLIRRSGADYRLTRRVEEVHVPEMVGEVLIDRLARLPAEPISEPCRRQPSSAPSSRNACSSGRPNCTAGRKRAWRRWRRRRSLIHIPFFRARLCLQARAHP